MIWRRRRIQYFLIGQTSTFQISYAYNNSVLNARKSDIEQEYILCSKRIHSFWDDPVGDMLSYLYQSRPWAETIVVIAHNAKAFDLQIILYRAILLKWQAELIMKGLKIMYLRVEHLVFLDSV